MTSVLLVDGTLTSPDLRRQVPAMVPDPFVYLEHDGRRTAVVNSLDVHIIGELDGIDVVGFEDLQGLDDAAAATGGWSATYGGLALALCRAQGVQEVTVPARFPYGIARLLQDAGIGVVVDDELFVSRRRVKTDVDLAGFRRAIRAVYDGWDAVRAGLREQPGITSEELQVRVLTAIAPHDVVPYDIVIVPGGAQSAIGHAGGRGTVEPCTPVIADLIMRDRSTGMYADITRTFCAGEPPAELVEYFELSREALDAAVAAVRPGLTGAELNDVVSEVFERHGQPTLRRKEAGVSMDRGFYHGLGHGVGFEVHEAPSLGPGADVPLLEGEVLCIEPALYRLGFGGCRLEDMVLVTRDGCERLSSYPYSLEV
jgi:Xaa-Pro aminopeptidase